MAIPNEQAYQRSIRDDTSLRIEASMKELPDVTAEDNGDLLTVINGEWGKGDAPYKKETTVETILAESEWQVDDGVSGQYEIDTERGQKPLPTFANEHVTITVDGVSYEVDRETDDNLGYFIYGEFDVINAVPVFNHYPFCLIVTYEDGALNETFGYLPLEGREPYSTFTLKIEAIEEETIVSDDFKDAVNEVVYGTETVKATYSAEDTYTVGELNRVDDINMTSETKTVKAGDTVEFVLDSESYTAETEIYGNMIIARIIPDPEHPAEQAQFGFPGVGDSYGTLTGVDNLGWEYNEEHTIAVYGYVEKKKGNGPLVIRHNGETLDKTWQEIHDALADGRVCLIVYDSTDDDGSVATYYVGGVSVDGGSYYVWAFTYIMGGNETADYSAESPNEYPA